MACQAASWIPNAVAAILRSDHSAQPIIAWLTNIRDSTEEYDPLITVKQEIYELEDSDSSTTTPDSAFDEILSQLGKEIYKLEEYQQNFGPGEQEVSLSILNIFDECLERFDNGSEECFEVKELLTDSKPKVNNDNSVVIEVKADENSVVTEKQNGVNGDENGVVTEKQNGDEFSDCESTLSDVTFVTSTPAKCDKVKNSINSIFYQGAGTPVPPRRTRLKTPSSSSSCYDNMELKTNATMNEVARRLDDSDSESTCWSYKECSDAEDAKDRYGVVWSHSSGFHNSDEILRRVLSQNHATISRLSFDTASDFTPTQYSVYALHEVGDRCEPVATMTPDKPDDGYEPVRDALTNDENIYEEIEYMGNYTDEGCSCGGSVEVESCSISASSEGVGRDSPLYANLRDHDAYAISSDVIYWKNLLLDPYYNEDEEDEWISPEESAVYSRDVRPPLVIPRITQYRAPRRDQRPIAASYEDYEVKPPVKSSVRQYDRLQDWSPTLERSRIELERGFSKASSDSPPFTRMQQKLSGSNENLLSIRRPNHLQLPASSSGDSLDIEVRESSGYGRARKSRSMVAAKRAMKSPVPAPRMLPPAVLTEGTAVSVVHEGPVKRTKFFENGKKTRKNWQECYMVLTQTALYFYKDQRTYYASKMPKPPGTPPSPTSCEIVLPLRNAHIIECIQTHTRRYARSLELTVNHDRYLLQDDSEDGAKRWLAYIQNVIYRLGPPTDERLTSQYQSSNTDLESLGRTPPVSRHSNRSKQKAGGSSNEDLSDSTESQKTHVKSRLRKFFAKRPSMEALVKKGIYKDEPVFGKNLEEVCPPDPGNPGAPRVPEFVKMCITEIERSEENMSTDGLYRVSGNLSQVQKIRLEIDQNNLSVIESYPDIHVLTGSLKLFFRELKEPLIPCTIFDRILSACSIKPRETKVKEFRDIIQSLPQCNRDTLKYLLEHLLRVAKYSERNHMHKANLAIVFGPTLLWAPAEQAHNIAIDCIQQNNVVDILLTEFKDIFEERGRRKS